MTSAGVPIEPVPIEEKSALIVSQSKVEQIVFNRHSATIVVTKHIKRLTAEVPGFFTP